MSELAWSSSGFSSTIADGEDGVKLDADRAGVDVDQGVRPPARFSRTGSDPKADAAGPEEGVREADNSPNGEAESLSRKRHEAIFSAWQRIAQVASLEELRAMSPFDFADRIGARDVPGTVFMSPTYVNKETWDLIVRARRILERGESNSPFEQRLLVGLQAKRDRALRLAEVREIEGPGIYYSRAHMPAHRQVAKAQLGVVMFGHELFEQAVAEGDAVDRDVLDMDAHGGLEILEHELRLAALLGSKTLGAAIRMRTASLRAIEGVLESVDRSPEHVENLEVLGKFRRYAAQQRELLQRAKLPAFRAQAEGLWDRVRAVTDTANTSSADEAARGVHNEVQNAAGPVGDGKQNDRGEEASSSNDEERLPSLEELLARWTPGALEETLRANLRSRLVVQSIAAPPVVLSETATRWLPGGFLVWIYEVWVSIENWLWWPLRARIRGYESTNRVIARVNLKRLLRLRRALHDEHTREQQEAYLHVLLVSKDRHALPIVAAMLDATRTPYATVRQEAAGILGVLADRSDRQVLEALVKAALHDVQGAVQEAAIDSLRRLLRGSTKPETVAESWEGAEEAGEEDEQDDDRHDPGAGLNAGGSGDGPAGPDGPAAGGPVGEAPIRLLPLPELRHFLKGTDVTGWGVPAIAAFLFRLIHSPPTWVRGSGLGALGSGHLPGAHLPAPRATDHAPARQAGSPELGVSKVLKQILTTLHSALRTVGTFIVRLAAILAPVVASLAMAFALANVPLPGRGRGFGGRGFGGPGGVGGPQRGGDVRGRGGRPRARRPSPSSFMPVPWAGAGSSARRAMSALRSVTTSARSAVERVVRLIGSERWEPWWSRAPPGP